MNSKFSSFAVAAIASLGMAATIAAPAAHADSPDAQINVQVSDSLPAVGENVTYNYGITYQSDGADYTTQILQQQANGNYSPYTALTTTQLNGQPGSTSGSGAFTIPDTSRYEIEIVYYAKGQTTSEDRADIVIKPHAAPVVAPATYQLCGTVVIDSNDNGLADPGETPVAGVSLGLSNGATTASAANGTYCFSGLANGTYTVKETVPNGYTATDDASGPSDGRSTITGATINGASLNRQDFGLIQPTTAVVPPTTTTTIPVSTTTTIVTPPPTTTTVVTPPTTVIVPTTAPSAPTVTPVVPTVTPVVPTTKPKGSEHKPKTVKPVVKPVAKVAPKAILSIVKQAARPVYQAGSVSTWTIKVGDRSKTTAQNVVMCDTLPTGTQFDSASRPVSFSGDRACFKLGSIAHAQVKSVTIKLLIAANTTKTQIINHAGATASNAPSVKTQASVRIPRRATVTTPAPVTG